MIHQRCFRHDGREAAARCPGCRRYFCRECVTEHDGRLLCAACVAGTVSRPRREGVLRRAMLGPAAAATGLLAAWGLYYGAARFVVEINPRLGEQRWRPH